MEDGEGSRLGETAGDKGGTAGVKGGRVKSAEPEGTKGESEGAAWCPAQERQRQHTTDKMREARVQKSASSNKYFKHIPPCKQRHYTQRTWKVLLA